MTGVRLRHIVLVVPEVDPASRLLGDVLGIDEVFREPPGLDLEMENAVLALPGGYFLEVCAGTGPDAPPARYERRFGPGGYMLLLQFRDFDVARARAEEAGARVVFEYDTPAHHELHLHPADTGAAIVGVEWGSEWDAWRWAGTSWRAGIRSPDVRGLSRVRVGAPDPRVLAERWERTLGVDFVRDGDAMRARLDEGPGIVFEPWERPHSRVHGIDLLVSDADAILERARRVGVETDGDVLRLLGLDIALSRE